MSRSIANIGGTSEIHPHRFAEFICDAIERAGAIKAVAVRWGVPEESLRRYRDGGQ